MRKLIIVGVGIVILIGAILISNVFKSNKKNPKQKVVNTEKTVFIKEVINKEIPITIAANGNLTAKNKVELFSEVQGVLQNTVKSFKAGVSYKKGQTLLTINSQEFYASIQSQRSNLQNLVASIMPDIRLDFPESFQKWNNYLQTLNVNKTTPKLPEVSSDKEKYFVTGRNIYTTYYSIKNLEAKLNKYKIRAPFNGVVTETLVTNGTLVRPGQKMGEFIDTSVYELTLSVNGGFADILKVGKKVNLQNLEKTKTWTGKVARINGKIDQTSQTVQVFVEVKGTDLKEGMYLEANVPVKSEKNAIEINRKLLVDNNSIYVVNNNVLELLQVSPVHFNTNTVVVKNVKNGTKIINKPVAGAYTGMPVKVYSEKK